MKLLIIATVLIGACLAQGPPQARRLNVQSDDYQQPQAQQQPSRHEATTYIPIIRFAKEQGEAGSYKALWETGNNIIAQEEGFLRDLGPDPDAKGEQLQAQVQQGSYEYTAPNGEVIKTIYTADETGFHVQGDHLPTPPPVSPEVQKGLDLIYAGIKKQEELDAKEFAFEQQNPAGRQKNGIPQEFNNNYRN